MLTSDLIDELRSSVLSFIDRYESNICFNDPSSDDKVKYEMLYPSHKNEIANLKKDYLKSNSPLWRRMIINEIIHITSKVKILELIDCEFNDEEFYYKWFNKPKPTIRTNFYWYSITGDSRIPAIDENINKMILIGKKLFNNDTWIRYKDVYWNVETGKDENNSNLHIHALIDFDKSNKSFDRDLIRIWKKEFKNYGINIKGKGKQHYRGSAVHEIWDDKLKYLTNDSKSILHNNYKDLNILEHCHK